MLSGCAHAGDESVSSALTVPLRTKIPISACVTDFAIEWLSNGVSTPMPGA